ncbi:hypothetical protein [Ornithinibacillus californiensis]|uniref:hypothetical protein n=1 Tax=Ornithinibacillus californiensis TaxID=161536 RepID=UPI00064DCC09|nr:hypothetical protein [Ornithinibacillus californiensis]
MPEVFIKVGQPVFVIDQEEIIQGNIVKFMGNNRMRVILDFIGYKDCTYGINVFMTRQKAEKILNSRQSANPIKIVRDKKPKQNLKSNIHNKAKEKNKICEACGLPIGTYGHCGCSY